MPCQSWFRPRSHLSFFWSPFCTSFLTWRRSFAVRITRRCAHVHLWILWRFHPALLHASPLQCSPAELHYLVKTLSHISQQLESISEMALKDLKSELLLTIIREVGSSSAFSQASMHACVDLLCFSQIPLLLKGVQDTVESLNEKAAKLVTWGISTLPPQLPPWNPYPLCL